MGHFFKHNNLKIFYFIAAIFLQLLRMMILYYFIPISESTPGVCFNLNKILVTGGAGFVGSHLVDALMKSSTNCVFVIDDLSSGFLENVQWLGNPRFKFIKQSVTQSIDLDVDEIYHLASPASVSQYEKDPQFTIDTNIFGTHNMLQLAKRKNARILLTSSSGKYIFYSRNIR